MQTYVKELKALAQKSRDEIVERNREIEEGVFTATDRSKQPLNPFRPPKARAAISEFRAARQRRRRTRSRAAEYHKASSTRPPMAAPHSRQPRSPK